MPRFAPLACLLSLSVLALSAAPRASAQAAEPMDLVRQAVQAQGGAAALKTLKRVVITADSSFWEPDSSRIPFGPSADGGTGTLTRSWDLEKGAMKSEWARDQRYPNQANAKYAEVITGDTGFVQLPQTIRAMSGIRVATAQREMERASPLLLLKALESPKNVSALPDQKLGGARYPAVAFRDGRWNFTILFDAKSHLPVAVRSRDADMLRGDVDFDLLLADWKPVGGAKMAHSLFYRLNDLPLQRLSYAEVKPNAEIAPAAFTLPDAVRQNAKGPARDNIPYQWVIRRINSGFFNDSDAVMYDAATSSGLKLAELSPTVQQVLGGTHNMLIVAMKDHLVFVDAPISEQQSLWAIKAAKEKYPGKPIRYLVMTHHHLDHSWGVRAFIAEGATLVVGSPGKSFYEAVAKADFRSHADQLQKSPRKATIIEVADRHVLSDGSEEVTAYRMDNPHAEGMLLVHVKSNNLAYNTDLYAPGRDTGRTVQNVSVQTALTKFGLRPAVMAGGHGSNGSYEDFLKLVSQ